jgi:hypothetical protein
MTRASRKTAHFFYSSIAVRGKSMEKAKFWLEDEGEGAWSAWAEVDWPNLGPLKIWLGVSETPEPDGWWLRDRLAAMDTLARALAKAQVLLKEKETIEKSLSGFRAAVAELAAK